MHDVSLLERIVTVVSGCATAGGLIFLGYQTLMLRSERNLTLRAWIGIGEPHWMVYGYLNDDDRFIEKEKFEKLSLEQRHGFQRTQRNIEIKNYGQLPAENLKTRLKIITGRRPTKQDLLDQDQGFPSTMMPSSSLKLFAIFSKEQEEIINNPEGELYIIWEAEYESPKGTIRKYGEISKISQRIYIPIKSWNEDD